tara:strand:+ start:10406 stop:10513 length:108 start_codon:yes stop_codon:yes gene_type:complete
MGHDDADVVFEVVNDLTVGVEFLDALVAAWVLAVR